MPGGYEERKYQLPMSFTEAERKRINNAGFSDEFKQQIRVAQTREAAEKALGGKEDV